MPHDWVKTSDKRGTSTVPKWVYTICESTTYGTVPPNPNQKALMWIGMHMIEGTCETIITKSVMDS